MATNFLWGAVGSVVNLLTIELNSLADASGSVAGPEVGQANDYQMGQLSLHLASNSLAFTAASYVKICFLTPIATASGGTYPTYASGSSYKLAEQNYAVSSIAINPATQSANVVDETVQFVPIPLGFKKAVLINRTGVTLPASGNTLNLYPTPTQY